MAKDGIKKPEWLPDWFDIKNYDSVASMGLLEWGEALNLRIWLNRLVGKGKTTDEKLKIENFITEEIISMATNPDVGFDYGSKGFEPMQQTVSPLSIGMIGMVWGDITLGGNAAKFKSILENPKAQENSELAQEYLKLSASVYDEFLKERYDESYAQSREWEEQRSYYGRKLNGLSFAQVDISAPDKQLLEDFKTWLKDTRELVGLSSKPQTFTPADMASWHEKRVLPYIDLTTWAKLKNINITQQQIGIVLFPDDFNISLDSRIRRTVKPLAEELMMPRTIGAICIQAGLHYY